MNITISAEQLTDYKTVFELVKKAFETEEYSNHTEHFLVERLRRSTSYVPELALVAKLDDEIVGYILLTTIGIANNGRLQTVKALALAPVAVQPEFQGKGVGSALIREAHERAKDLGFDFVVVLGHADYYPKFGYQRADLMGISIPFEAPAENVMVVMLGVKALDDVRGEVVYSKAFFES